jgi:hypothetical protein
MEALAIVLAIFGLAWAVDAQGAGPDARATAAVALMVFGAAIIVAIVAI